MNVRFPFIACALLIGAHTTSARADSLFGQNPYECVFAAKASRADNATRRSDLADCMVRVVDTSQALRVLDNADFDYDYQVRREVESKIARGERWYARALLADLINGRAQTPARVAELTKAAAEAAWQQKIASCLSNPDNVSPSRDRACTGVPGFRNSTGRINPPDAEHSTGAAPSVRTARTAPKP